MAFLTSPTPLQIHPGFARISSCPLRMTGSPPTPEDANSPPSQPTPARKLPVTNSPPSTRKLVRNKPGTTPSPSAVDKASPPGIPTYADARAGDMVGAPQVGEGLGPRRGVANKKVTRAAAIQKSQSFADAWAEQNQGRVDVWLIIGALTILTPLLILAWAIATGVIPTAGLFDE